MTATSAQKKSYRKQIGRDLKVRFPDGRIIHAWQLWEMSLHSPDPASDYLSTEATRIEALYEKHAPEVPSSERLRRALRMALKLAAFEVLGPEGDAADLRILMLANGLTAEEFDVVTKSGEPMVRLDSDAMRRLGAAPGDTMATH